jgi:eukaryotic-like serine/threonine-protein kinase
VDPTDRLEQIDDAIAEYLGAIDTKAPLDEQLWLERHSSIREELVEFLEGERDIGSALAGQLDQESPASDKALEDTTDFTAHRAPVNSEANTRPLDRIGSYDLLRLLGQGGMGRVYEAIDAAGNPVAVKVLSRQWARSAESLKRFKQEGEIAAAINHPRCVFVKSADEDQGKPYIVMELMSGETLKDLVNTQGSLTIQQAVSAIVDVLEGLEEAHSCGMIHRDIKPANCYVDTDGRIKLGDFGLARSVEGTSDLTRTGSFVGTPLYASPEQVKGESLGVSTDIYSVCATLYFLLTGQAPFTGSSPTNVIAKIVSENPRLPRELNPRVPRRLEHIVMRGLNRDRNLRYRTAAELRHALEPFLSGRQAVADWGRRVAAYGLDCSLLGIVGTTLAMFLVQQIGSPTVPFSTYLVLILPLTCYFVVFEVLGHASPGKRLLRLEIVDSLTAEPPSRLRRLQRTVMALALGGVGTDLLLYGLGDPTQETKWVTLQWSGYLASLVLVMLPLVILRGGRMLLHDWASRTMVVDSRKSSPQNAVVNRTITYRNSILSHRGYPEMLGDYTVTGLLWASGKHAVLSARDTKLDRDVWIQLAPGSEPALPESRQTCSRTTRLRWLTGGTEEGWRWDAFLAFEGAPLKHWVTPESTFDWSATREILRQLIEELEAGHRDGSAVKVSSVDQVWRDDRGRIALLDWSFHEAGTELPSSREKQQADLGGPESHEADSDFEPTSNSDPKLQPADIALLRESARLALCGVSRPFSSPAAPVEAILPLHARSFLASLVPVDPDEGKQRSATDLLADFKSSAHRSTIASLENRAIGLGAAVFTCAFLVGILVAFCRMGNNVIIGKLSDSMLVTAAVDWALTNEVNYDRLAKATEGSPTTQQLRNWLDKRDELLLRWETEYVLRFEQAGNFNRTILANQNVFPSTSLLPQLSKVHFEWASDNFEEQLWALNWQKEGAREQVDLKLIPKLARAAEDAKSSDLLRGGPTKVILVALAPLLSLVVWIGVLRGGIAMWLSGLRVVDSAGNPASWWLHLLRAFLTVLPLIVVQFLITTIDLVAPGWLFVSTILAQVELGLFVLFAVLILAFPRRAPQDMLLGTHLVPK